MHRLPNHPSKCAAVHGHRYKAVVTVTSNSLLESGMVVDFGILSEVIGSWIDDHWDHNALLCCSENEPLLAAIRGVHKSSGSKLPYLFASPPTAEVIAAELGRVSIELLTYHPGAFVSRVEIWETPNCKATWIRIDERDV